MISSSSLLRRNLTRKLTSTASYTYSLSHPNLHPASQLLRHKSTQSSYNNKEEEETGGSEVVIQDVINFPSSSPLSLKQGQSETPVLLNSKEHAVGYLNRILNARVYEAAIETKLQHAKSLSMVSLLSVDQIHFYFLISKYNYNFDNCGICSLTNSYVLLYFSLYNIYLFIYF